LAGLVHDVACLVYLMLPVYAANMAAPFARFWPGPNPPLHARLLGEHKTVVGVVIGVLAATGVAALMTLWPAPGLPQGRGVWILYGVSLGVAALGGDSAKSFVKRRRGMAPGASWVPADQLDFLLPGMLVVRAWVSFGWKAGAIVLILSFLGDLAVNRISYRLGIRSTPL
jgi:CDP-2,3-bis-(O-geranylgeranyl)-sn-glycerol synthase